jgi:hypothetical protein
MSPEGSKDGREPQLPLVRIGSIEMSSRSEPGQNSNEWEIVAGAEQMVPWQDRDISAAWVWTLRHRSTGEIRELSVRVTWKGFDSIEKVPSRVAREASLRPDALVCRGS